MYKPSFPITKMKQTCILKQTKEVFLITVNRVKPKNKVERQKKDKRKND